MNWKLLTLSLLIGILFSCSKEEAAEETYEATGMLLGQDLTLCACCGGCVLTIDNDSASYRFESLPADATVACGDMVAVKFNYTLDRECNTINYLFIDEIELQ